MCVPAGGYRFAKGNAKYDYSYIHHTYETEWLKNSDMRSFCAGTKEAYSGLKVSANIDNLAV